MSAQSLALLTDLYQLTMAYGYWKVGLADRDAAFHLFFRKHPFGGNYTVAAGLESVVDFLDAFRFADDDVAYLATLTGSDGKPLFEPAFLEYLGNLEFACDVHAVEEGEVMFPHSPLIRVSGPLAQCQIIETPLLNMVNFQTLIATKAARICAAARGEPVLEFGLRRAQGIDGGMSASRAAYIGGCAATSNVLAGKRYDVPVKGTHAHAWVMAFDTEREAFEAYADAMPNNCVFLVDTYDTVEGVRTAVEVGKALRERGYEMVGVRLDSGDLAQLSIDARAILDEAGFPDAAIVASNDLDEYRIAELKERGATIAVWGVGTRLATAYDQPALGGVYKLAGIREEDGTWEPRMKLSNMAIKVSNPGLQQTRRYQRSGSPVADVIWEQAILGQEPAGQVVPHGGDSVVDILSDGEHRDLLVPVYENGRRVYELPDIHSIRERSMNEVQKFIGISDYRSGLSPALHELKMSLLESLQR